MGITREHIKLCFKEIINNKEHLKHLKYDIKWAIINPYLVDKFYESSKNKKYLYTLSDKYINRMTDKYFELLYKNR